MDEKNKIADLEIAPLTDETLEEVAGGSSDGSSGSCCSCCSCSATAPAGSETSFIPPVAPCAS